MGSSLKSFISTSPLVPKLLPEQLMFVPFSPSLLPLLPFSCPSSLSSLILNDYVDCLASCSKSQSNSNPPLQFPLIPLPKQVLPHSHPSEAAPHFPFFLSPLKRYPLSRMSHSSKTHVKNPPLQAQAQIPSPPGRAVENTFPSDHTHAFMQTSLST